MEKQIDLELLFDKIKEKNITLIELSKKTGISTPHLSMMFKDKRNMTIKKLNKILKATNIDIEDVTK